MSSSYLKRPTSLCRNFCVCQTKDSTKQHEKFFERHLHNVSDASVAMTKHIVYTVHVLLRTSSGRVSWSSRRELGAVTGGTARRNVREERLQEEKWSKTGKRKGQCKVVKRSRREAGEQEAGGGGWEDQGLLRLPPATTRLRDRCAPRGARRRSAARRRGRNSPRRARRAGFPSPCRRPSAAR